MDKASSTIAHARLEQGPVGDEDVGHHEERHAPVDGPARQRARGATARADVSEGDRPKIRAIGITEFLRNYRKIGAIGITRAGYWDIGLAPALRRQLHQLETCLIRRCTGFRAHVR